MPTIAFEILFSIAAIIDSLVSPVIGFVGDKLIELKQYQILKSEKIQSRMSEKLADGTLRYIVRIGLQKFIVDVVDDDIKYVMDLC